MSALLTDEAVQAAMDATHANAHPEAVRRTVAAALPHLVDDAMVNRATAEFAQHFNGSNAGQAMRRALRAALVGEV